MSHAHTSDEIRLSQERRDAILNVVLEYFTGDQIDRKTLGHFAFLAEMFGLNAKVREMVGRTSSIQGRQELCVSLALAALNLAVSDEPVQRTERQIERRERREAAKQFERSVTKNSAIVDKTAKTATKALSFYNRPRSSLTSDQLAIVRTKARERQARWKAKRKTLKNASSAALDRE